MTRHVGSAAVAGVAATLVLGLAGQAGAAENPVAPAQKAAAHKAATAPATLDTLSRFFARDGAVARSAAAPRVQEATVPVHTLSAEFVAGKKGAPVSRLDFLAATALSSDGQKASLWMAPAPQEGTGKTAWKVVNIATGDDETRYAADGARKLPGGTVFREPQTDAWYVHDGARVLPLDDDATRAVGAEGATLAAYQNRVHQAYGDKLPGSAYAKQGKAGGYGAPPPAPPPAPAPPAPAGPRAAPGAPPAPPPPGAPP
ncbi:hypothetical protein, partial [Streptomyces sp. NPDC054863]